MEVCQRGKIKVQAKINKFGAIKQKHLRTPELSQVVSNARRRLWGTRDTAFLTHYVRLTTAEITFRHHHHSLEHTTPSSPKRFLPIPASDFERQSPGDRLRDLALPTGDVSFAYWRRLLRLLEMSFVVSPFSHASCPTL